ncbi:uncharacterized protein G2W53_042883 [Senna tora]|uniref:Uncharacterized protein n=1 Tax=Senna tora TaxID=362788 RepID=A0A834SHN6_9FABA|nr:uncharacterized protein G2W53_042883 [Senna tora]
MGKRTYSKFRFAFHKTIKARDLLFCSTVLYEEDFDSRVNSFAVSEKVKGNHHQTLKEDYTLGTFKTCTFNIKVNWITASIIVQTFGASCNCIKTTITDMELNDSDN